MIAADGTVKVLDFGLAKLRSPVAKEEVAPTRTAFNTDAGASCTGSR